MFATSTDFNNAVTLLVVVGLLALWSQYRQRRIDEMEASGERKPWWF